jgi:hypothetical protein
LIGSGFLESSRAEAIWRAFGELEAVTGGRMITPAVLEVIARRPRSNVTE